MIKSEVVLCREFDLDILSNRQSLRERIQRSEAARQLKSRGRTALVAIASHLERHRGLDQSDLRLAWGALLYQLELQIGTKTTGPVSLHNTPGWIAWAKKEGTL